ncbi:lantibiotic dehydratase [Cytobacillus sp. Hm23]
MVLVDNKPDSQLKQSKYFQALDFYMVRSPLLPLETYIEIFDLSLMDYEQQQEQMIDKLVNLAQSPIIRESIAVSSLSLLESLPNISNNKNKKKRDQAIKGFTRYLIRMISRPTPYGLCSGVLYGNISNSTSLNIGGISNHQKKSRPDMEWLLSVIKSIETLPNIISQLYVSANPMVYFSGSRAKLPYVSRYGEKRGTGIIDNSSIRITPVVEFVLNEAKAPILYTELLKRIREIYPQADEKRINHFLMELFEQEFLISNLRPPITISDPFSYFLNQLKELKELDHVKEKLSEVSQLLNEYDTLQVGKGEKKYKDLVSTMNKIAKVKNPIQVDMKISDKPVSLPGHLQNEVSKVADVLWRLSPHKRGYSHLDTYKEKFLNKYGSAREVPILTLLDEDLGLGAPPGYQYPVSRMKAETTVSRYSKKREGLLMEWLLKAQKNNQTEIELNDNMIQVLEESSPNNKHSPSSLELYFTLTSVSQEEVDKGNYNLVLTQNTGSNGAGKTFGRFSSLLGDDVIDNLKQVHQIEEYSNPDHLFAELSYLPAKGRATNVTITPSVRPYEITFGTNSSKGKDQTIPLNDIVVGLTMENGNYSFYLRSKKLGKNIIPTCGHMLNMMYAPNIYRFLRELSNDNERRWEHFSWGALESSPFLPRLRYGKAILSLARWKLYSNTLSSKKSWSHEKWFSRLQQWRDEWDIPRYVYMTEADNRILLDLENPLTVSELRRDYEKQQEGQHILLTETGFEFIENPLKGEEGHFLMECVFPIVKKHEPKKLSESDNSYKVKKSTDVSFEGVKKHKVVEKEITPIEAPIANHSRVHLPGGKWIFLKLYGLSSRIEEFIGWHMKELYELAKGNQVADQWFFMRYSDPNPHIRLRFKGEQEQLYSKLMPIIHQWGLNLQREGLVSQMVIDSYDPEIERYGGPKLIELAEKVFEGDSIMVTNLIRLKREGAVSIDLDMIAVICTIDIMERFSLSFKEQLDWFNKRFSHKEHLKVFRKNRKPYMELGNSKNDWESLRNDPEGILIYNNMLHRRETLQHYAQQVHLNQQDGILHSNPDGILASIIHMTLNRFGISFQDERRVMHLVRHTLHNLRYSRGIRD